MATEELTPNRLAVLELIAEGLTHRQIAARLGISATAVGNRAQHAVHSLGGNSIAHAVLLACRAGILDGRPFLRHGDHAGYEQHVRRRIPLCEPCREGEREYRAGLKSRKLPAG